MYWRIHRSRARLAALGAVVVIVGGVACSAVSSLHQTSAGVPLVGTSDGPPAVGAPLPPAGVRQPAAAAADTTQVQSQPAARDQAQAQPPAPPRVTGASGTGGASNASAAAAPAAAQPVPAATTQDASAQLLDRMVIRTAQLTVEVPDIEHALAQARDIASRGGGYVSASNTHSETANDQSRMVADLTLQVRSDAADSTMSDLRALGKVTAESSGSQDVTDEYVDLDSDLRNLQASETAILKLMDRATQIQDVLSLQRELTNVRGQIERIQGRKTYLERRTDLATITLGLRLPPSAASQATAGSVWNPIAAAQRGWQASLTILRGLADVVIVAVAFSWWLIPVVIAGGAVFVTRRRAHRSTTATAPAPAPAPADPA